MSALGKGERVDWPAWVEHVFGRIAQRWREIEESGRGDVTLLVETLAPDLAALYPHDDLFGGVSDEEWAFVPPYLTSTVRSLSSISQA